METKIINKECLDLDNLNYYTGTEGYTRIPLFRTLLTDGIIYVMSNGYSWLVTDALSVLEHHPKVKDEPFKTIKFKVNTKKKTAKMIITDGNDKALYSQIYKWTDAKKDLTFFCCDGVLMLDREY